MIDDPPWFQVSEEDVGYQVHQRHREATAPDADLVTGEGQEAAHLHGEHDGFAAPQRHLGALVVHDWHQPDHLALHNSRSIIVEIVQAWEPFINEGVQLVHYVAHGRELPTAGPHCHVHTKVVRGIKGHCNT